MHEEITVVAAVQRAETMLLIQTEHIACPVYTRIYVHTGKYI